MIKGGILTTNWLLLLLLLLLLPPLPPAFSAARRPTSMSFKVVRPVCKRRWRAAI
jgi:hypothetical protein